MTALDLYEHELATRQYVASARGNRLPSLVQRPRSDRARANLRELRDFAVVNALVLGLVCVVASVAALA